MFLLWFPNSPLFEIESCSLSPEAVLPRYFSFFFFLRGFFTGEVPGWVNCGFCRSWYFTGVILVGAFAVVSTVLVSVVVAGNNSFVGSFVVVVFVVGLFFLLTWVQSSSVLFGWSPGSRAGLVVIQLGFPGCCCYCCCCYLWLSFVGSLW